MAAAVSSWTTSADVRAAVQRYWDSGRLLAGSVPGHEEAGIEFPLRISVRKPRSAELGSQWEAVQAWAASLMDAEGFRVETAAISHRALGTQRLPAAIWIDSAERAIRLIRRAGEAARFDQLVGDTDAENLDWVAGHPLRLLEIGADWPAVQAVARWLREHPTPGMYVRQVELPGVHTKIIETHKRTLAELVPGPSTSGAGWFERRYGFRTSPGMVRFRTLDSALELLPGVSELVLPSADFARLCPPARTVFVTENLTNYLCWPDVEASVVVFGSGNQAPELLAVVPALQEANLYYTGDLDTHGFAILDRFRAALPQTQSMLMDADTLLAHRELWVVEPTRITRDLPHLRPDEQDVYDGLRTDRWGHHVRLEQERIGFDQVREAVRGIEHA
jgi:hypothetical protein